MNRVSRLSTRALCGLEAPENAEENPWNPSPATARSAPPFRSSKKGMLRNVANFFAFHSPLARHPYIYMGAIRVSAYRQVT